MKSHAVILSMGLLSAAATGAALAQSTDAKQDQPKAIGVSQDTANKVDAKAKANGDAMTVVRTGPTAGERAGEVASKTKEKVGNATTSVKNGADDATTTKNTTTKP